MFDVQARFFFSHDECIQCAAETILDAPESLVREDLRKGLQKKWPAMEAAWRKEDDAELERNLRAGYRFLRALCRLALLDPHECGGRDG